MRVIVCNDYDEMSKKAASLVASQITLKPNCVLGLATGSTPIGLYDNLVEMNQNGEIDFSSVTSFNLDEYYPLSPDNDQSYRYFMNLHLFDRVNIDKERTYVPNGLAEDAEAECAEYEKKIADHGGIDLQILGIGQNGHIGFNEPDENLISVTHLTGLTDNTIEANSRFFASIDDVPKKALTMGIGSILKAKRIILLASGKSKRRVVRELLNDNITTSIPATMLKVHPDVVLICDKDAYSEMYLGVDIGGTAIKLGVIDSFNNIVYKDSIPTQKNVTAKVIADDISAACKDIAARYPIGSIGIGTPGIINFEQETVSASNLPFDNSPIVEWIREETGLPVLINNDANCAALGEAIVGEGADENDIFMVTLGTGVGGGIIINKRIYSGKKGGAGEIGHMCIEADGKPCTCGSTGCWESYASVTALIEQTKAAAEENPDSILAKVIAENGKVDGKTVFEAMDKGCEVAEKVFDKYTSYIAVGIKNIVNIFRPGAVVIAGGISVVGDRLLKPIQSKVGTDVPIKISHLKNDAGMIGAALLGKDTRVL
ncbi:MAG: glucosamine-6-phosphate deaminase [Clostridia bacterium]|nr:glucosamine-6-phosphate deaminase [Clostridia bacterium]